MQKVRVPGFHGDKTAATDVRCQQLTARGDYSSTVLVDPPVVSGCMYLGHSILQSHLFKTRSWLSSRTPPCTTLHTQKMGWNQPILRRPGVFFFSMSHRGRASSGKRLPLWWWHWTHINQCSQFFAAGSKQACSLSSIQKEWGWTEGKDVGPWIIPTDHRSLPDSEHRSLKAHQWVAIPCH